ncbi:MAG: hypothetical protein ACW963_09130 [Candidatus Sifarchaeia archaeon]|jgi:hypothetical protein
MTQQLKVKLPGTLYFIDLTMNPATNTGKVTLERKAVEAQKTLSDLNPHSIQGVLLDLLDAQGLNPNPRLISRLLEDLTEPEVAEVVETVEEPKVIKEVKPVPTRTAQETVPEMPPVVEMKAEAPAKVDTAVNSPLLKFKDVLAAATFQMSQLDSLLKESTNTEVESAMKSLQNLLTQAKSIIDEIITS